MRAAPQIIALATIALLTLGVVMVTSASMSLDDTGFSFDSVIRSKTGVSFALALAAMLLGAFVPLRMLTRVLERAGGNDPERFGLFLLALAGGLLLIIAITPYLPGFGHAVHSSRRWIRVPGIASLTIQPSEIVKWGLVLVLSVALWLRREAISQGGLVQVLPILALVAVIVAPIALEDLGTGVLIVAVSGVLIVAGGACWWKLAPLGLVPIAGVVGLIAMEPYRMARVRTFLDPFADPQGDGYHVIQSMATIAGGEGFGRGLGMGIQKFGYLPEDQTDFVFAIVNEELGLAGAALVIFLYLAILWSGFAIARGERHLALKLIAIGVVVTVGAQAAINLLVVTGWAPAKGIPLPLISAGGTGWIMTAGSLGLLISIDRSRGLHDQGQDEPWESDEFEGEFEDEFEADEEDDDWQERGLFEDAEGDIDLEDETEEDGIEEDEFEDEEGDEQEQPEDLAEDEEDIDEETDEDLEEDTNEDADENDWDEPERDIDGLDEDERAR